MDNILTFKELKEKLKVSDTWLYRKVEAHIIPHFRIGGMIRFSEKEIMNWLQSHQIKGCQKI